MRFFRFLMGSLNQEVGEPLGFTAISYHPAGLSPDQQRVKTCEKHKL